MPPKQSTVTESRFPKTMRRDNWWITPVLVFIGLFSFIAYSTWAAFQGNHYTFGPYLSPFYSPEIFGTTEHAWFGPKPGFWPQWMPYSPAFLILWAPAGFRMTCYYYRGAYYKAFWADPPACAVSEPRKSYRGENSFPLIIQNVHRYLAYVAMIFIVLLAWDAIKAFNFDGKFGIGVGSLVLTINVILLGGYTFGCHSLRHIFGGFLNEISKSPVRQCAWKGVSCLNTKHQIFAWCSLVWVGFTDVYIRLCSMGIWTDFRIL
jgi:hypothetical protein